MTWDVAAHNLFHAFLYWLRDVPFIQWVGMVVGGIAVVFGGIWGLCRIWDKQYE